MAYEFFRLPTSLLARAESAPHTLLIYVSILDVFSSWQAFQFVCHHAPSFFFGAFLSQPGT